MESRLIDLIGREGPLPFDQFMEMCLYDPEDGYFATGGVRAGTDGDFVTSPEVSPWFGRFLGRWAVAAHPGDDAILVEIGAGSGSLLEPLIDEVGDYFQEVFAVELSHSAREAIAERIPSATVVSSIHDLPAGRPAVVIANEVLDNMPSHLVERTDDGWSELSIGLVAGSLSYVSAPADSSLSAWCDTALAGAPTGSLLSAQRVFADWTRDLAAVFGSFTCCLVDYAGTTKELSELRRSEVVRSYRSHRSGPDYLSQPGQTDITMDVNTDVFAAAAHGVGARLEVVSQRAFLGRHGAFDVLAALGDEAAECARAGDVMGQLSARSASIDIGALLDEDGLGGFSVLLMSGPQDARQR